MKSIEIKSEGFTYRYDFEPTPSTDESFEPNVVIPVEAQPNPDYVLSVCLQLLRSAIGKDNVRKALMNLAEIDY